MLDLMVLTLSACAQFTLPAARLFSSSEPPFLLVKRRALVAALPDVRKSRTSGSADIPLARAMFTPPAARYDRSTRKLYRDGFSCFVFFCSLACTCETRRAGKKWTRICKLLNCFIFRAQADENNRNELSASCSSPCSTSQATLNS